MLILAVVICCCRSGSINLCKCWECKGQGKDCIRKFCFEYFPELGCMLLTLHQIPDQFPNICNATRNNCIQKYLSYLDNMLQFNKGRKHAPRFWPISMLIVALFVCSLELSTTWVLVEHEDQGKALKLRQI